ncbi:MAG: tRNA pseudouridine(55) synthase TruB [Micavibrio sp.]|nr:tRNA pseudouridine(55) synthase TruB [Micavibrio sp.]
MAKRKKGQPIHGWVNFYKPKGMTSTQAVGKVRWIFNAQKAGHAGTLDPLAEGILPIALGEATKTVSYIQDAIKIYAFDIIWGEARSTEDAEGDVTATSDHRPSQQELLDILPVFTGDIEQTPPAYSAIKIDGERAYDIARRGETPEMKSRPAYIESIECKAHSEAFTSLEVICGKGTYVRSLGRDIALKLGSVAYIDNLRRLQVGAFDEAMSISLDKLEEMRHNNTHIEALLPVDAGLDDIPSLPLTDNEASMVKRGQVLSFVSKADNHRLDGIRDEENPRDAVTVLALCNDKPVGFVDVEGIYVKPKKLFNL